VLAADNRSFARAATTMGVKQSTLSRRISLLESRIGMTLFERSTRGAVPTEAGRSFMELARGILADLDGLIANSRDIGAGRVGTLGLGFSTSLASGNMRAITCSKMAPDGFGGMVVLITADAVLGKSTEDMLCDLMDQAEHGEIGVAPGHGALVLLRLDEKAVRTAIGEILIADATFVPMIADDVTEAEIREACHAVATQLDLTEVKDQAEFNAAQTALRAPRRDGRPDQARRHQSTWAASH
jgi:hypothetical protein